MLMKLTPEGQVNLVRLFVRVVNLVRLFVRVKLAGKITLGLADFTKQILP
jgi:hypothetical protein